MLSSHVETFNGLFFGGNEVMCGHRLDGNGKNPGVATFAFEIITKLIKEAN